MKRSLRAVAVAFSMLARSLILGLLLSCGAETVPTSEGTFGLNDVAGLPDEFDIRDLAKASIPGGMTGVAENVEESTGVLVWVDEQDEGFDRVLTCIVWQAYQDESGAEEWALTELFCHPERGGSWQVSYALDAPYDGQRVFSTPPSLEETYQFLRDAWWTLGPEPRSFGTSHEFVGYEVCEGAWLRTIGALPERPIPAGESDSSADEGMGLVPLGYLDE